MPIVYVPTGILAQLERDVRRHHKRRKYRPVAVAIARDAEGRILLIRSTKGEKPWGFPQGGVEKKEGIINGLRRELYEETRVRLSEVLELCLVDQLEIPGRRRDGFKLGKRYYYFHVACKGFPRVIPQPEEVCDHQWLFPQQAIRVIANPRNTYPEKRESMLRALRITLHRGA